MGQYMYRMCGSDSYSEVYENGNLVKAYHYKYWYKTGSITGVPKNANELIEEVEESFKDTKVDFVMHVDTGEVYRTNGHFHASFLEEVYKWTMLDSEEVVIKEGA